MNLLANFSIARLPRIEFGNGAFTKTASFAAQFGQRALLVTGGRSLRATPHWDALQTALKKNKMSWVDTQVRDEHPRHGSTRSRHNCVEMERQNVDTWRNWGSSTFT